MQQYCSYVAKIMRFRTSDKGVFWYLVCQMCQIFGVWCAKCAKYLAFGTLTASSVYALAMLKLSKCTLIRE